MLKNMRIFYLFLWAIFSVVVQISHATYAENETSLIQALRTNYSTDARPESTTQMIVALGVFALNTVDIGSEVMSLSGLIIAQWHDPRLMWDPTIYGIDQVIVKTKHVWIPPLVIENEINTVGVLGSDGAPLRITADGTVFWTPPISTSTSCSADITYYPYDKQVCTLTLTGWSYTVDEVNVSFAPVNPIVLTYYSANGEWDLRGTGQEAQHISDGPAIYRKLHFKMTFRRKWPYYGQNIILPIILNSVLMALVFAVPIESGEKMGYCLTVLLTYIVLLTMVSDDLPAISNQTSVVQMYLSIVLCLGTASTICTIGVLRLYNHDESEPICGCLQKLTKYVLAPLICRSCKSKRIVSPEIRADTKYPMKTKSGSPERLYSGKEMAVILDTFFFRIFAAALLCMTTSFVATLLVNYEQ